MRLVMDSTLEVSDELREKVVFVPLKIELGGRSFLDGQITLKEMFEIVRMKNVFPKTSQPSPADFERVYSEILKENDWILSIHITSGLSGTISSARMAAEKFKGRVYVVDTGSTSIVGQIFAEEVLKMEGEDPETIVRHLESLRDETAVYLTVENLEFLKRSGRLRGIEALIGSILNLRPLIESKHGYLKTKKVYRSNSKVLNAMKEIASKAKKVVVGHIENPSVAEEISKFLTEKKIPHEIISVRSCSLSAHLGPGSYGIAIRM